MPSLLWSSPPVDSPTLIDYLQQLRKQGISHIPITDQARQVLRELYTRGSARRPSPSSNSSNSPETAQKAPPSPSPTSSAQTTISPSGSTPAEKINSLAAIAQTWPAFKNLQSLRETLVFSTGNPQAELMLVGEAPGFHDEQQQEPFVGPAGNKLDQILKAMGLSRQQIYLSNICKFRPATKNQTTNNRPPSPQEMASSLPFLKAEIEVVKPRIIIALGASAAHGLLETTKKITELRESWHQFQGIPLRVSYHPSYLLRQEEGLGEKRKVWEDMLAAMDKLGLPISEKQRGYFQ